MGSGNKRLVFNTRERALSTDFNRAQAFLSTDLASIFHYFFDSQSSENSSGGRESIGSATTSPLRALILGGIRPRPEIGTANLFIEPGCLVMVDPDLVPLPDDIPLKWIVDPGIQTTGILTLPAAAGANRIDVIECRRTEEIVETDSRDIFDNATGLFTPGLVDKVIKNSLEYRIREGIAGAGFPGTANGWLPLAVYVCPPGALTWDDIELLWDVRPLASDLTNIPSVSQPYPVRGERSYGQAYWSAGDFYFEGFVESSFNGKKIGGFIDSVNLSDHIETGWVPVANQTSYIYCAVPFGLPRWAQYTLAGTGIREPSAFRGIFVHSMTPCDFDGTPLNPITMPAMLAFAANSSDMRCILACPIENVTVEPSQFLLNDGWITIRAEATLPIAPTAGSNAEDTDFEIPEDTVIPRIANSIRYYILKVINAGAGVTEPVQVEWTHYDPLGTVIATYASANRASHGQTLFFMEMPLPLGTPYGAAVTNRYDFRHSVKGHFGALNVTSTSIQIAGWRLNL